MKLQARVPSPFRIGVLFLAVLTSLFPVFSRAEEPPAHRTSADFTFYTCGESPAREVIEGRLAEAFRRIGRSFQAVLISSCQRSLMLANTEGDGDMARVPNIKTVAPEDTTNLSQIPESVYTQDMVVFTKSLDFPVTGWASLAPYSNGARLGSKLVEANLPGAKSFVKTTDQLFQMLDSGRIQTAIEFRIFGERTIRELGLRGIKQLSPPLVSLEAFPLIHNRHAALVDPIVQALRAMKLDGTYAAIERDILGGGAAPAAAPPPAPVK